MYYHNIFSSFMLLLFSQIDKGSSNNSNNNIKLAWLITATDKSVQRYHRELSSINCYAAMHQIPIHIESHLVRASSHRDLCQNRIQNIVKYLKFYDWLFVSDADIIIANYSQSLKEYVDNDHHVILHTRDGGIEVTAGMFFIRNTYEGIRFVHEWYNISDDATYRNSDNGDLQELLHQYIVNDYTTRRCLTERKVSGKTFNWEHYIKHFLLCAMKPVRALFNEQSYIHHNYISINRDNKSIIKIYREYMGYFRSFEGNALLSCTNNNLLCNFMNGDFILHGKDLYKYLIDSFLTCSDFIISNNNIIFLGNNITTLSQENICIISNKIKKSLLGCPILQYTNYSDTDEFKK